LGQLGWHKS